MAGKKRGLEAVSTSREEEPWFVSAFGTKGKMSEDYIRYMSEEWGFEKRGDRALFEKLCLEGAQAGLSWSTILKKRDGYRAAFSNFDLEVCANMTKDDIDKILAGDGSVIRHRGKLESVLSNAKCVLNLVEERRKSGAPEPSYGYFDEFIWSFVEGRPQLNTWKTMSDMPAETLVSINMSQQLKARGFKFVGPKICYSLMQSCGLVVDHLHDTPEWHAARHRIAERDNNSTTPAAPLAEGKKTASSSHERHTETAPE